MLFGLIRTTAEIKAQGAKRSSRWPAVRNAWIKDHPTCACCGGTDSLEVHHKIPFHVAPMLELDGLNLITLCESKRQCHLRVGHYFNWKLHNPDVERMAAEFLNGIAKAKGAN